MSAPAWKWRPSEPGHRVFSRFCIIAAHWAFATNYEYRRRRRRIMTLASTAGLNLDPIRGRHDLSPNGQDIYDDLVAKWSRYECKGKAWR